MTLQKLECVVRAQSDVYGWPASQCVFPTWVSSTQWTDVTQHSALYVTSGGDVMLLDQRKSPPTLTNHTTSQVRAIFYSPSA